MTLKIINWNVGRPTKNKCNKILDKLNELGGDIVILTETNSSINLKSYDLVSTDLLPKQLDGVPYKDGENRVSIWTKFPATPSQKTFNGFTSVCTDIPTPFGLLTVYGTIIGIFGGTKPPFHQDLQSQLLDFDRIFPGKKVCLVGDYNIIFSGQAYPSHLARETLNDVFQKFALTNLTATISDCVDHIALSDSFIKNKKVNIDTWNLDKVLSDHIGISVTLEK